ncbi:MAG: GNAT family N-acetyltransferase [Xanthomonadaceae bacterium]|nr:GNAT family N-acetyltransferase [Xanthomonadaceae bacterium]
MAALQTRVLERLGADLAAAWDALDPGGHPFTTHAFLHGLEADGCLRADLGWRAHHVTLWRGERLVAAAPAYRKMNSHGEFVFDHAWANAWARCGLPYYPKLLCAVPYSPVTGPRLRVAADEPPATRIALAHALGDEAGARGWSGAHVNFPRADDAQALEAAGWLRREDVQFHWTHGGWETFDDFIGALNAKRRKEIRRERSRVAADGWVFETASGACLDEATIDRLHGLYVGTFADKGNYPALTRAFFLRLARDPRDPLLAVIGRRAGRIGAMALCLRGTDTLYGRYWGSDDPTPGLHFEACYYQGIEWCIRHGIRHFEPGAQGEHKIARGFLPAATTSFHWLLEPTLRTAVARALERERRAVAGYAQAAAAHSPFAERA